MSELPDCRQGSDSALSLHNNQRKDTRTQFNSYMVIYFSITIMQKDAECFLMEGNNSILRLGEQT